MSSVPPPRNIESINSAFSSKSSLNYKIFFGFFSYFLKTDRSNYNLVFPNIHFFVYFYFHKILVKKPMLVSVKKILTFVAVLILFTKRDSFFVIRKNNSSALFLGKISFESIFSIMIINSITETNFVSPPKLTIWNVNCSYRFRNTPESRLYLGLHITQLDT